MRYLKQAPLYLTILAAMLLVGCGESRPQVLGDAEYESATGAARTTAEVAEALRPDKPAEALVLDVANQNLENALQMDEVRKESPELIGAPLTTSRALVTNPAQAVEEAQTLGAQRDQAVKKEQEKGWFSKVIEWGGWASVLGFGLFAARLAGVPGVQYLSDPLIRMIGKPWISKIEEKEAAAARRIKDLTSTVESSMVGRAGLKVLDDRVGDKFADDIQKITKGQATTVEGLFKWLAAGHASDAYHHDGTAVKGIIDEVKDRMPTVGGLPTLIDRLLTRAEGKTGEA